MLRQETIESFQGWHNKLCSETNQIMVWADCKECSWGKKSVGWLLRIQPGIEKKKKTTVYSQNSSFVSLASTCKRSSSIHPGGEQICLYRFHSNPSNTSCWDIPLKSTKVNLILALEGKSEDHQPTRLTSWQTHIAIPRAMMPARLIMKKNKGIYRWGENAMYLCGPVWVWRCWGLEVDMCPCPDQPESAHSWSMATIMRQTTTFN